MVKTAKPRPKKNQDTPYTKHAKSLPELSPIVAKTENQELAMKSFSEGRQLVISGFAGTGKSYVACALGLAEIARGNQERLAIYRSAVPTRDLGFLKGSIEEKEAPYEAPYKSIFSELYRRGDAYEILKKSGVVEFSTSSYLRGLTLKDTVVLVDECQNWTFHELDSIMTRLGHGSRIIFCGDYMQTDLQKRIDQEGLSRFLKILKSMREFSFVEMGIDDIVRSELVRSYLIAQFEASRVD